MPPDVPRDDDADGRLLRRERNRAAIVEALLELCDEGIFDASAAQIAERAGLSPRSLFRYFDDVDDLYRTACEEQFGRVAAIAQIHRFGSGSLHEKIESLVEQRMRIHKSTRSIGRVARASQYRIPAIAKMLAQGRDANMDVAVRHLQAEFDSLDRTRRLTAYNYIDVFLSFESFERFAEQGLTDKSIRAFLTSALEKLFVDAKVGNDRKQ